MHTKILENMKSVPTSEIPIIEIFPSIEGEGSMIGYSQIFIRVGGCPVGCQNCDSKSTWKVGKTTSVSDVVETAIELSKTTGIKRFSITGGEPAIYKAQVTFIASQLRALIIGSTFNLETSGDFLDIFDYPRFKDVFQYASIDLKPPSSGVPTKPDQVKRIVDLAHSQTQSYHMNVQLKCPVANLEDLRWLEQIDLTSLMSALVITPAVDPANDELETLISEQAEVLRLVQSWSEGRAFNVRFIPQIHKLYSVQ